MGYVLTVYTLSVYDTTTECLNPRSPVAQFEKLAVEPGIYTTPDGVSEVSPDRIRHWHDTIQGILASGYSPPLCWAHPAGAEPHVPDDEAYWTSRFNAGRVTGSRLDEDGRLFISGDAPGLENVAGSLVSQATLPSGLLVKTSIDKVSIGVRDWIDGRGKTWHDAPIHLGLVTLPVWEPEGGQPGFAPAPATLRRFGTDTLLSTKPGKPMADKKPPFVDDSEDDDPEPDDAPSPSEPDEPTNVAEYVEEAKTALARMGVNLPANTDAGNILERICVACAALQGQKASQTQQPDINTPVTEEPGGTFMSTATTDPMVAALVADREARDRKDRLAMIEALGKRGLPPHQAKKLRERATTVRFALDATGKPAKDGIDDLLEALDASLPKEGAFDAAYLSTIAGATEVDPPEGDQSGTAKNRRIADEWAKNARLPARKAV